MRVLADRALLPRLYDAAPKIVVFGAVPVSLPIHVVFARHDPALDGVVLEGSSDARPADPPVAIETGFPGLWAVHAPEGDAAASAFAGWAMRAGKATGGGPEWTTDTDGLVRVVLAGLQRHAASWQEHCTRQAGEIYALRREVERLERLVPRGAEVTPLTGEALAMCFSVRPDPALGAPTPGPGRPLEQYLPIETHGLAGFDLHLEPGPAAGPLVVRLRAAESGGVLAAWVAAPDSVLRGWNTFWLPRVLDGEEYGVHLGIEAAGRAAPRVALARTVAGPVELPGHAGAMLALRLWRGRPGTQYDPRRGICASGEGELRLLHAVPREAVAAAECARELSANFRYFRAFREGRILLHPVRHELTVAVIPDGIQPDVSEVRCAAFIDSPLCRAPIEARILAARRDATLGDVLAGEGVLGDSGWVEVSDPPTRFQLRVELGDVDGRPPWKLFLMSQIRPGQPHNNARLIFADFEMATVVRLNQPGRMPEH